MSSYAEEHVKKFKSKFHVFGLYSGLQNLDVLWKIYCVESFQTIFHQKWFIIFVMVSCPLVNHPNSPLYLLPNLFKPQYSPLQSQLLLIPQNSGEWDKLYQYPFIQWRGKKMCIYTCLWILLEIKPEQNIHFKKHFFKQQDYYWLNMCYEKPQQKHQNLHFIHQNVCFHWKLCVESGHWDQF